ncbi:MAG: restriction endonuclease subunit S [Planctomycetes bacterium]|nr:restriction endonuclease subunit S [Planctomycetota bacterium]
MCQIGEYLTSFEAGVSVNGSSQSLSDSDVGVLKVSCVRDGRFLPDECKAVLPADRSQVATSPRDGDIVISRANTPGLVGACALVKGDHPRLYLSDKLWRTRLARPDRDDLEFVLALLQSGFVRQALSVRATGTSAGMKNISQRAFRRIEVPRPSLRVQQCVGRAMRALASAESLSLQVLSTKRRLKRALLQRFVDGGSLGHRVRCRLGDVTREISGRNRQGLGPESVMGVLKNQGLVPMREGTIADDLSAYRRVPRGAFAYNPMRINIGSIAYSWHESDVLVSPDYVVFQCDESKLDPRYMDHLRHTSLWSQFVKAIGAGSVRVRIYYRDLARFSFSLPPLDEQHRIASMLDKLDSEIALLNRQLTAYRTLKRGVMQKLLLPKSEDEPTVTSKAPATREVRA